VALALSYDGRRGARTYGSPLPASLGLRRVELVAGRSSQATLLGRAEVTIESLYLSRELGTVPGM
jgi:DNA adenine methylase